MSQSRIQLVCFDLGGVCIRICANWQHAFDRAGIAVEADAAQRIIDHASDDLTHLHETGRISSEDFCKSVADRYGLLHEHAISALEHWLIEPYPGLDALLDQLADAGIATACLSNTSGRHWHMMQHDSRTRVPLDRLTHHFTSHTIGAMKPDAAIYEHVERHANLPGEAIVFFDDRADNVAAAQARGWFAHVIDPTGDTAKQMTEFLQKIGVL